ncbi:hypothetical protein JW948_19240 [bacterium]|nr:hypothetical protein [bacterium]
MKTRIIFREDGIIGAIFILLMVTLGTLALSAYLTMQNEVQNTVNHTAHLQVEYSANAAAYYGIKALREGLIGNGETEIVNVAGVDVELYAEKTVNADNDSIWLLNVYSANPKEIASEIEIELAIPRGLENYAISSEKDVQDNIVADDEGGTDDTDNLIQENIDLPDIDVQGLIDMSVLQLGSGVVSSFPTGAGTGGSGSGHGSGSGSGSGTITYGDSIDSLDPFYYWLDGEHLPHIIYIDGDATFKNTVYHGIYVVTGDVTIQCGQEELWGVVLQLDPDGEVNMKGTHGGRYHFSGGLVAYGEVTGNGNPEVQHVYEYMKIFTDYANQNIENLPVTCWRYM